MKGREYTRRQIGRALAAYDVAGDNASLASKIVDIPRTTILDWLDDDEVLNDDDIGKYRQIEKKNVQEQSYQLASLLIPRIMEKAMEDNAKLRDIVGAYSKLMEKGNDININMVQEQMQRTLNDRDIEEWLKDDKDARKHLKELHKSKATVEGTE